jgi:hypothetical protein
MHVLKGFVTHSMMANNTPGIVAQIGEISTQSMTYAREKGLYRSDGAPNLTLVSFLSKQDGNVVTVGNDLADHTLLIAKYIYDKAINSTVTLYADQLLSDLFDTFDAVAGDFECGEIVDDGQYMAPEWLSWTNKSITDLGENTIKIWFADESFRSQYDEFEIVVIPPIDNLDNFFKSSSEVRALVTAFSPSQVMDRVNAVKGIFPETAIRAETFNYIDPFNSANKIPVTWHLLVYGLAGNNSDSISDALQDYILANTTHPRADWLALFPDIFRRTEFTIVPLWDQYGIPNRVIEAGIYSPLVNLKRVQTLFKQLVVNYPGTHIDENLDIMSHPYKSLQLMIVGGPENRENWFQISQVYKDYINVSSTSLDFNRMTQPTKDWALMLLDLLLAAEKMTEYSSVPPGMSRVIRGSNVFISKSIGNIMYLVLAKKCLPTVITGE